MNQIRNYNYEISENGEVVNLKNGRVKGQWINTSGYYCVELTVESGKKKKFLTHRLVAEVYLGYPENEKLQVDHINRNRLDNSINNLRWVSVSENSKNKKKRININKEKIEKVIELYKNGFSSDEIFSYMN